MIKRRDVCVVPVPLTTAEIAWRRCRPLYIASAYDDNPVRCAIVSAYLQGLMDATSDSFRSTLDKLKNS